jgi:hypothetical protein
VLDYVRQQRLETITKLTQLEREARVLRGALAAYDDLIEHSAQARAGGSVVAAPTPPPAAPPPTLANDMATTGKAGLPIRALRIGHGPVQADDELRE